MRRASIVSVFRYGIDQGIEGVLRYGSRVAFAALSITNNISVRAGLRVYGVPIVRSPLGRILIGENVVMVSSSWRCSAAGLAGPVRLRTFMRSAEIIIGNGVGMNGTSITARSGRIAIGEQTMIGPDCIIMDSDFHIAWPPERRNSYPGTEADADVTIGPRVWLGARCIVLKGTRIGENTVVAAGSVVSGELPPNCLAAGVPAKVKRTFDR